MAVFIAPKFSNSRYFCITFSFVVILSKNSKIQTINRYCQERHQEFYSKFSVHIFHQGTMFLAGKTLFQRFLSLETRAWGLAKAQYLPLNDSIDRS